MVAGFGYGDYGAFLAVVAVVVQSIRVVGHPYKTAEVGGQAGSDGRASRANGLLGDDATIRRAQAVEVKDVLAVAGGRAVGIKHQQAILAVTVVVARTDGDVAIGRGKHQALVVEAGERLGPAGVGVDEEGGDGDYGEDYYGQDGNVAAGGGFEEFTERRPQ